MIGISTIEYDIYGFLKLNEDITTKTESIQRRVSKTATLDGGVSLGDMGYTDSDRTFDISISEISAYNLNLIIRLMKQYPLLHFSTSDGYFSGVISALDADILPLKFTVLIKEKLA